MKNILLLVVGLLLLQSCSNTIFDPTHIKEGERAKKVRQGHTQGFAGPN